MRNKADTQRPKHGHGGNRCQIYLSVSDDTTFLSGGVGEPNPRNQREMGTNQDWGGFFNKITTIKAVTRERNHPNPGIVEQAKANSPRVD